MNGRLFRGLAVLFLLLPVLLPAPAARAATPRPNVIFILTDDLGYGDVGVFFQAQRQAANHRGEPWHLTPKLDTLAAGGLQLRQHYCPAPVCAPSRASLLLGVHQGHANVRDNQFDKALEDNHTVASVLRQAGYATACIGKWGLQGTTGSNSTTWAAYPTRRGFDYYYGYVRHNDGHEHYPKEGPHEGAKEVWENDAEVSAGLDKCYTTDLFTSRAKQWIIDHRAATNQPFFLYLAYDTPHAVLEYPPVAYPAGAGLTGGLQWLGTSGHMINTATGTVDSYCHPDFAAATYDDDGNPGTAEVAWPAVYKRFATSVTRLDDAVGDLQTLLDDLGIGTNTLVVFTSDNGPSNEDYLGYAVGYAPTFFNSFGPFDGMKRDCWEGGIRVGALVRWPGTVGAGRVSNQPCSFVDWLPTFAELAGVPAPARTDGVSLVPTLTGLGAQRPPTVYVEYNSPSTTPSYPEFEPARRGRTRSQMQAIRIGDRMGVRYNTLAHADAFEIYDVAADPKQTNNLAAVQPALQQAMKDAVLRLRRPDTAAPRPYDAESVPAVSAVTAPGLAWRSFATNLPWVAELTQLTPAATGTAARIDLSVRPRDNDLGLLFTGYLLAPSNGVYTLHLSTDSRALLRLHEATVLDADRPYTPGSELSATVRLAAGKHPLRLYYARATGAGTPSISLQWNGTGGAKQAVPDSALLRDYDGPNTPPACAADAASTPAAASVLIDVLANDTDDGQAQPLALAGVDAPRAGTTAVEAGAVRYTPAAGFLGQDRFAYRATDGMATSAATVAIDVFHQDGDYWYPFNQSSGLSTLEAGGGRPAALVNYADAAAPWTTGRWNRAVRFVAASSQYVSVTGFYGLTGTAARTCCAWVRTTGAGQMPVIAWGANSTGNKWTFLLQSGNPRLEITGGYRQGATAVHDGQWHHVACTFTNDGSPNALDVQLYVDGVPETNFAATLSQAVNTTASQYVKIGSDVQNRYFDGLIDEPRVYARALPAAEIAALAAASNPSAAAWHRRHFGAAAVDWLADDEGDGGNRLLEYALGGEPHLADADRFLITGVGDGERLRVRYPRLVSGSHELLYRVLVSGDLWGWSDPGSSVIESAPAAAPDGFEEVTVEVNADPGADPQFGRLQVLKVD